MAEKVFPMPEELPFEDVWISMIVKKNAQNIHILDRPMYLYRQHDNQTFGGIINYSKEKVIFRAKRLLALMDVLENEPRVFKGFEKNIFDSARVYNGLMSKERLSVWEILKSELRAMAKLKIILIKRLPVLAKYVTILKWKLDALLSKN
jgi:hypothetical protein